MAVRRCEPLSRPFVYQELSARSLLITQRSWPRAGYAISLTGSNVPEAFRLADPLAQQQVDVLEEEPTSILERDHRRGFPARERGGLLKDPGVAQRAAADEHPGQAIRRGPFDQL